jgi:G2/mitotic-specific cyclin-B, other
MNLTEQSKENLQSKPKAGKQVAGRLALQTLSESTLQEKALNPKESPRSEYSSDIFNLLLKEETNFTVQPKYLGIQKDITSKIRSILIDWVVSVHKRFKLLPETLFLSVKIIDRYLSLKEIPRKEFQLLGVSSLFLASKYEEIYPPELRDLILLTDKAYTKDQAIVMEREILKTLDYNITMPSSWRFFEKMCKNLTEEEKSMGQYLLELSLIDEKMIKFSESILAACAVYLSKKIFKKDYEYSLPVYSEHEIRPCAVEMLVLFQVAVAYPLTAVQDKFSMGQYHQVSTIYLE